MTELELLEILKNHFPTNIIYSEDRLRRDLTPCFIKVRSFAKKENMSSDEWLSSKGFSCLEMGFVEKDMQSRDTPHSDATDAFALADWVFQSFPLAGEYTPSETERLLLYNAAQATAYKFLKKGSRIQAREQVVLVLATIQLIKPWIRETPDDDSGSSFWSDIYRYYGIKSENLLDNDLNHLYAGFRGAIKYTFSHYQRFLAKSGHYYYTSMMLHAMAPKASFEALFRILITFYDEDLGFQYSPQDIVYKTVVKGMQARLNEKPAQKTDLHLRSDTIYSGLRTLFMERPGYMAVLCDEIVQKMNGLLHNDMGLLSPEERYLDYLLVEWFQKISLTQRADYRKRQSQANTEFVATSKNRISIQYAIEHQQVGIVVPRIRLEKIGSTQPILKLYQNETLVAEKELTVHGKDLAFTTGRLFLPLADTAYNFNESPSIRSELSNSGDILYDSGEKLKYQFIVFNESGHPVTPKSGIIYLFAKESSSVDTEADCIQKPHQGQLLRLNLDKTSSVAIDGLEIFADKETSSQFRHHVSQQPLAGIQGLFQGREFDLFKQSFQLNLHLPKGENPLRYQAVVNGQTKPLNQYKSAVSHEFTIPANGEPFTLQQIKLIDIASQTVDYQFEYAVLPNCAWQYSQPCYRYHADAVEGTFIQQEISHQIAFSAVSEDFDLQFSIPGIPFSFFLNPPFVKCQVFDENAFQLAPYLWYKDIHQNDCLSLDLPTGWTGRVVLCNKDIVSSDGNSFEVGNAVFARHESLIEGSLALSLESNHQRFSIPLSTIVFKPKFLQSPLDLQETILHWHIENNYIGQAYTQYTIDLTLPNGSIFTEQVGSTDCTLQLADSLPLGQYPFQISTQKNSIFAKNTKEVLYNGVLSSGHPNAFRFQHKELHLSRVNCWDFDAECYKKILLRVYSGIACDLLYLGEDIPSGESVALPHYTATLYFSDSNGYRHPFNWKESPRFELVNPIHIWIVNDYLLIIAAVTEDALYVDNQRQIIMNQSVNTTMSKSEQRSRLETPDYFEYKIEEVL